MPALGKFILPGVLGLTTFFALIDMIISAILVSSYNSSAYPTTHIKNVTRFTLFVSIWHLFIGGAYIAFNLVLSTSIIASVASNAAFLFITWIFWLASAASTESALGGPLSCSNPYFAHCHQLLAMEAFAWINFILLIFAFGYVAFLGVRGGRKGEGLTAPISSSA